MQVKKGINHLKRANPHRRLISRVRNKTPRRKKMKKPRKETRRMTEKTEVAARKKKVKIKTKIKKGRMNSLIQKKLVRTILNRVLKVHFLLFISEPKRKSPGTSQKTKAGIGHYQGKWPFRSLRIIPESCLQARPARRERIRVRGSADLKIRKEKESPRAQGQS